MRVPATSANLGPGFDALGLALDLFNTLTLTAAERDQTAAKGEGAAQLSALQTTIAHDGAHRVLRALNCDVPGVALQMHNAIPLARGLGSSSAAIVGGMLAANEWARRTHNCALSPRELVEMATAIEGHPDNVAPALMGGLVAAAVGEMGVAAVRVPINTWPGFAVWIPDAQLSTQTARGVLPDRVSRADAIYNLSRAALLVAALSTGDWPALAEALNDRLHQAQRAPLVPAFDEITRAAREAGALGATLSGAGPTILSWSAPDADLAQICAAMRDAGPPKRRGGPRLGIARERKRRGDCLVKTPDVCDRNASLAANSMKFPALEQQSALVTQRAPRSPMPRALRTFHHRFSSRSQSLAAPHKWR